MTMSVLQQIASNDNVMLVSCARHYVTGSGETNKIILNFILK